MTHREPCLVDAHSVRRLLTADLLTTFPSLAERTMLRVSPLRKWLCLHEGEMEMWPQVSRSNFTLLSHLYPTPGSGTGLGMTNLSHHLVSALAWATVANHHPGAGPSHPLSYGWKKEVSSVCAWATPPPVHPLLTRPSLTVQDKLLRVTKKCSGKHSARQT